MNKFRVSIKSGIAIVITFIIAVSTFETATANQGQSIIQANDQRATTLQYKLNRIDDTTEDKRYQGYYSDLKYLLDNNIIYSDEVFKPDDYLTTTELFNMLARAFGDEEDLENPVQACAEHHWLKNPDLWYPNVKIQRAELYFGLLNATGIEIYNPSLYGKEEIVPWRLCFYTAQDLGLTDNVEPGSVTHREAAYLFHQLLTNEYTVERPDIIDYVNIEFEEEFTYNINNFLNRLLLCPQEILDKFHSQGWTIVYGDDRIKEYDGAHGTSSSGLTYHAEKAIYVNTEEALLHEIAHFIYPYLDTSRIQKCYKQEKSKTAQFISAYSTTNSSEYFAEYFEYYLTHKDIKYYLQKMKDETPLTYSYIESLENTNWFEINVSDQ